ncbi:hypothetical protein [Novosphingobium sp.]|nr:hypothetical protein [Novosphingobium sp.]
MNAAGIQQAGKLLAFALLLFTVLHFAERIIAGVVQCPSLGACPWR